MDLTFSQFILDILALRINNWTSLPRAAAKIYFAPGLAAPCRAVLACASGRCVRASCSLGASEARRSEISNQEINMLTEQDGLEVDQVGHASLREDFSQDGKLVHAVLNIVEPD